MRLSLYTAARDCLRNDYPIVEMLRHHLPLADELIVNEGYSTDGTYEAIRDLDPKIHVFRSRWEKPTGEDWWIHFKDAARRRCTGDWCLHLDSDEFVPDWDFADLRAHLETTSDVMIPTAFVNFYGNHRVYHRDPASVRWVTSKMIIHRNLPNIEFWGDGSNVKLQGQEFSWNTSEKKYTVFHYGAVRHPGRLREAWWTAGRFRVGRSLRLRPPSLVFDLFPHDWRDPDFLPNLTIYDGPSIEAVRRNPNRFIRDNMLLLQLLSK
jgi:hypothetical protein